MINNKKLNKKGFTLTELIVVIVIIGILAAVLIPSLTGYIKKANESADTQKVRNLNSLLYDVKISEDIEVNDVLELKQYLKEEMEYDGDFKLKTEGSYLWYNTEKVEFVVVKEKEVAGLKAAESNYKLVATLTSPEGLLEDAEGNELWLVGGNGALVDVVAEIRNVGNTGVSTLSKYASLSDSTVKSNLQTFFANYAFLGTKGTYVISADGTVTEYDENVDINKTVLLSDKTVEIIKLFHEQVIVSNVTKINADLEKNGVKLNVTEYAVEVEFLNADPDLAAAASAIFDIISILKDAGCESGYIIPEEFDSISNYTKILSLVFEANSNYDTSGKDNITEVLNGVITSMRLEDGFELTDLYLIDLSLFEGDATPEQLDNLLASLVFSIAFNYNDDIQKYDFESISVNQDMFKGKEITLIGNINSQIYSQINVEYDFTFKYFGE